MGSGVTLHCNILDAFLAEATACYQWLLFANEIGFVKVEVKRDSRTIIEKINQEGFCRVDLDSGRAQQIGTYLLDGGHSDGGERDGGCRGNEKCSPK
ncbi:hypothetical protein Goklo_026522, partial [Gossypium klotzschianum]|nr:hypothetical protein [Gossypium klotzschianum]